MSQVDVNVLALRAAREDLRLHEVKILTADAEMKDLRRRRKELAEKVDAATKVVCGEATPNLFTTTEPDPTPATADAPVSEPVVVTGTPPAEPDAGNLSGWRRCPWTDLGITNTVILKAIGDSQLTEIGELADALRLNRTPFGLSEYHADHLCGLIDDVGADDPSHSPLLTDGLESVAKCRTCGCTEDDCSQCIEKTGLPCHWVEDDLCSACVGRLKGEPIDSLGVNLADLESATCLAGVNWKKPPAIVPVSVNGRPYTVTGITYFSHDEGRRYELLPLFPPAEFDKRQPDVSTRTAPGDGGLGYLPGTGHYGGVLVTVGKGKAAAKFVVGVKNEQRTLLWVNPKMKATKQASAAVPTPKANEVPVGGDPSEWLDLASTQPSPIVCKPVGEAFLRDIPGITEADADRLDAACLWTLKDLEERIQQKLSDLDRRVDNINQQVYKVLVLPKGAFSGPDADRIANAVDAHLKVSTVPPPASPPTTEPAAEPDDLTAEEEARVAAKPTKSPGDERKLKAMAEWRRRQAAGDTTPTWGLWAEFVVYLDDAARSMVAVLYDPGDGGVEFHGTATSETGYHLEYSKLSNGQSPKKPLAAWAKDKAEELATAVRVAKGKGAKKKLKAPPTKGAKSKPKSKGKVKA